MTKIPNRFLIKHLFLVLSSASIFCFSSWGVAAPRKDSEAWSKDQELLRRAASNRQAVSARPTVRLPVTQKIQASAIEKLKQLEFEFDESLEQKDLARLDHIKKQLSDLFPNFRLAASKRLFEAHLRFEKKQLGASLELVREILRDPNAKEFYPKALLLRAQAFRDLGLETAALGSYDLLVRKFPRTAQAQIGEMEAKVIRLSVNRYNR